MSEQAPADQVETPADVADEATGGKQSGGAGTEQDARGIETLPEWAQDELRAARADAAKYRTRSQETERTFTDRLTALEAENRAAKIDAIKARHKVSDEDAATFFTDGAPLEQIEKIAASLAKRAAAGPVVPREGTRQGIGALGKSEEAIFARSFFSLPTAR